MPNPSLSGRGKWIQFHGLIRWQACLYQQSPLSSSQQFRVCKGGLLNSSQKAPCDRGYVGNNSGQCKTFRIPGRPPSGHGALLDMLYFYILMSWSISRLRTSKLKRALCLFRSPRVRLITSIREAVNTNKMKLIGRIYSWQVVFDNIQKFKTSCIFVLPYSCTEKLT